MDWKFGFGTLVQGHSRLHPSRIQPPGEAFGWGCWLRSSSARRDRRSSMAGRLGIRRPSARLERWMDRRRHHGATRILFIGLEALWKRILWGDHGWPGHALKKGPALHGRTTGSST